MKYNTLKIKSLLLSSRMKPLFLTDGIPMQTITSCPACAHELKAICALRSTKGQIMRVGFCEGCGYTGYMDRPTREWVINYYSSEWDKEFTRTKEMMVKDVDLPRGGAKGGRYEAVQEAIALVKDTNRPICEVGSGYGQVMKNFEMAGFKNIVGVENSTHRSKLVNEVFGFPVIHGEFGSSEVEEALKGYAPFSLMFSYHVLEHVYDPESVVRSMARLQNIGDFAVFALPDIKGEHINYTSLYLAHLHSFSKISMEKLFNRCGYELVKDGSPSAMNMMLIFQRKDNPERKLSESVVSSDNMIDRFGRGLGLDQYGQFGLYSLRWEQLPQGGDPARAELLSRSFSVATLKWLLKQTISFLKSRLLHRVTAHHILLVQPMERELEYPTEIWFEDKILLLLK